METGQAELRKATQEFGKAIYEKAARGAAGSGAAPGSEPGSGAGPQGSGGAPGSGGGPKGDDTVIDADYEVKN